MAVNAATYIVQHEVHPHLNNSSPSPLLFLPSHVSHGVSKKGLACFPLVSQGHFDPGSLLLQKTLCGSVQPVLSEVTAAIDHHSLWVLLSLLPKSGCRSSFEDLTEQPRTDCNA